MTVENQPSAPEPDDCPEGFDLAFLMAMVAVVFFNIGISMAVWPLLTGQGDFRAFPLLISVCGVLLYLLAIYAKMCLGWSCVGGAERQRP